MVDLALEIRANHDLHARRPAWLFYKVTLTNRSCMTLPMNLGWIFHGTQYWSVESIGKDGEKKAVPGLKPDTYLWRPESDARKLFQERTGIATKKGDDSFDLAPGASVSPIGEALRPYRRVLSSWKEPDRAVTGYAEEDVAAPPNIDGPPPGFMVLGYYSFPAPGRYLKKAVFDQHGVLAAPIRPYAHLVPRWWRDVLENLGIAHPSNPPEYHVEAVSSEVAIEVKP